MADHSLQGELERAMKAAGLAPGMSDSDMKPGDTITVDTSAESLYVHIPTPGGIVGRNIVSITFQRPTA